MSATKSLQYEMAEALVACGHSRGDAVKKVRALVAESENRVVQSQTAVRRERIARHVLSGLACAAASVPRGVTVETFMRANTVMAVGYADLLIEELDK